MSKRVSVPISAARSSLFQLVDRLRKSEGDAVVILEQRGETEHVALVRESRLAYLEERVMQMDRQQPAAFKLGGSLASGMSDAMLEQALHELRLEWITPDPKPPAPAGRGKRQAPRPRRG